MEIQILRHLSGNVKGTSLFRLSAKTGMTREQLQRDSELFLQKHDLMEIGTAGRQITGKGLQYLKDYDVLKAQQAASEASESPLSESPLIVPASHQIGQGGIIETEVIVEPLL